MFLISKSWGISYIHLISIESALFKKQSYLEIQLAFSQVFRTVARVDRSHQLISNNTALSLTLSLLFPRLSERTVLYDW